MSDDISDLEDRVSCLENMVIRLDASLESLQVIYGKYVMKKLGESTESMIDTSKRLGYLEGKMESLGNYVRKVEVSIKDHGAS